LSKSKSGSGNVELKIYKKWRGSDLKDKNLLLSTSINKRPKSEHDKYDLDVKKDKLSNSNSTSMLKNISSYLNGYFFECDVLKRAEKREKLILREIEDREKEGDPDEILEQLWAANE